MEDIARDIANNYGIWALLAYILAKDILPQFLPQVSKTLDRRIRTEDRLFAILNATNTSNAELTTAIVRLKDSFDNIDETLKCLMNRMEKVEHAVEQKKPLVQ